MDRLEHIKALLAQPYGAAALAPGDVEWLVAQLSEAQARLAEIERQEPVAYHVTMHGKDHGVVLAHSGLRFDTDKKYQQLYAAPVAPAAQAAQAVADGLALLPAEATDEMQDNMRQALIDQGWDSDSAGEVDFADIWHAGVYEYLEREADMLAAQQQKEGGA